VLTPDQFLLKQNQRFANNEFQNIKEVSFRQFAAELVATFVAQATANVPDYEPGRYYIQGFIIRHSFGGAAVFLAAGKDGYLDAPTDPEHDPNWPPALSQLSQGSQVGTVAALRLATGSWVPGWLYVLIGRLDANGNPLPDVYVRALSTQTLEPEGYALDNTSPAAVPEPVAYDLATDTTEPVVSASSFADLLGGPYDNPALAAALANLPASAIVDFALAVRGVLSTSGSLLTYDASTGQFATSYVAQNAAQRGLANGYAPLDSTATVPAVYLPAYVDEVEDYATFSAFPATGRKGVIYLADDDLDGQWRWSNGAYRKFNSSIGTTDNLAEGAVNRYFTVARMLGSMLTGYVKDTAQATLSAASSLKQWLQQMEWRVDQNTQAIATNTQNIAANTQAINGITAKFRYPVSVYYTQFTLDYFDTAAKFTSIKLAEGLSQITLVLNGTSTTYTAAQLAAFTPTNPLTIQAGAKLHWQAAAYLSGFNFGTVAIEGTYL
jgi:hypothetical protein